MAVNDGVGLVGTSNRLINALGKRGHCPSGVCKPSIETLHLFYCQIAAPGYRLHGRRTGSGDRQGFLEAVTVLGKVVLRQGPVIVQPDQQAIEQQGVGSGAKLKVQISEIRCRCLSGIDDHHSPSLTARCTHSLVQYRVGPGGVAAREHQQVRQLKILVATGNTVLAKSTLMCRNGRGHAQSGIGIHMRCADEPLGQLVGNVIILRE